MKHTTRLKFGIVILVVDFMAIVAFVVIYAMSPDFGFGFWISAFVVLNLALQGILQISIARKAIAADALAAHLPSKDSPA